MNTLKDYDPYARFDQFRISKVMKSKNAVDGIFCNIYHHIQENLVNNNEVLVGRIAYSGESPIGHAIAVQFNLNRYRYRDLWIHSFKNVQKLMSSLYELSQKYFETYDHIEVSLWKLPYRPK